MEPHAPTDLPLATGKSTRRRPAARPANTRSGKPGMDMTTAVSAFHAAFGLHQQPLPSVDIDDQVANLRITLVQEEVAELVTAVQTRDLVGIADALADIVYVVYGMALTYGIDLDRVLAEVHRSNMSKLDSDGKPAVRTDGKVIKSECYSPPRVAEVLRSQPPLRLTS